MTLATPYQGSGTTPEAPLASISTVVSIPSQSTTRRRKSSSPASPSRTLPLSLSSEHLGADGEESSIHSHSSASGNGNGDLPRIPMELDSASSVEDGGRRVSIREMICNYLIGKSKLLIYGQMLSLLLATTGAIQSTLHLDCHLSAPAFSMFSFFFPTSIFCLGYLIWEDMCRRNHTQHSDQEAESLSTQQQERSGDNEEVFGSVEGPQSSNDKNGTVMSTRKIPIRARPEKRNNLLSHWSLHPPSTQPSEHDNFYIESNDGVGSNYPLNAQNPSMTKSHSLFGLGLVRIHTHPGIYAMIAAVDAAANYTTLLAFKYTTITSVTLLDALAIPSAIIVSRCFFGRRYKMTHLLGVVLCGIGITLNVFGDYKEDNDLKENNGEETAQQKLIEEEYPHKLAGDLLGIAGGVLFGVANTLQEVTVKDSTVIEYLGCMTFFAAMISLVQALILEQDDIMAFFGRSSSETCSETEGLALFFIFAIGGVASYAGIGAFLQISDAAFFNLSLLTGDAWSVAFSVFGEGIKPPPSFYVALVITVSGVIIYETAPSPVVDGGEEVVGEIHLTEIGSTDREESNNEHDGHVLT